MRSPCAIFERSCNALVIEASGGEPHGEDRLLRFLTADGLDAVRIVMPSFYQRFSARFGDSDLLVAIPSRDTLSMIGSHDQALANILEWRSLRKRTGGAYPLSEELMLVSESGITLWPPGS